MKRLNEFWETWVSHSRMIRYLKRKLGIQSPSHLQSTDYQQKGIKNMNKPFKIIIAIAVIAVIAATVIRIKTFWNWANKTEKYECEIEEIQNGIYVRYQSAVSRAPAHNYEIITVCIDGKLITYKGSVEFIFTENENKIEVVEKPNLVRNDKVIVYTSKDSVEYLGTVGIGN